MQLKIDPEFQDEIPTLDDSEKNLLEQSILSEGCRDSLVVWEEENILIDGHHRYDICTQHDLPFNVVRRSFGSRLHALVWMHQNQGARRNISKYFKDKQALRMVERLEALGIQAKSEGGIRARSNDSDNNDCSERNKDDQIDAWQTAADTYGTSKPSMSRTKTIEETAPDTIREAVASSDMSRTRGAKLAKEINKLPEPDRNIAAALCGDETTSARDLVRLFKSMGKPLTNGTYREIISTGGFHYGDDMQLWLDFANSTRKEKESAYKSVSNHHAREQAIARREALQASRITEYPGPGWSGVIDGDMREVGGQIPDNSIDLIFTDPPYPQEFLPLFSDLCALGERVLKPGGILLSYSGQMFLPEVMYRLGQRLDYVWMCAIRHAGGVQRIFKTNINVGWKPIVMYAKPPFKPYWDSFIDITSGAREKDAHEWQQAEAEAAYFIRALCPEGGTVFDPFVGGGTTLVAAKKIGIDYIGIEIDPEQSVIARGRIDDTQAPR